MKYFYLVNMYGFDAVCKALELTAYELNVLLAWNMSSTDSEEFDVRESMDTRMSVVKDIEVHGFKWIGEVQDVINGEVFFELLDGGTWTFDANNRCVPLNFLYDMMWLWNNLEM